MFYFVKSKRYKHVFISYIATEAQLQTKPNDLMPSTKQQSNQNIRNLHDDNFDEVIRLSKEDLKGYDSINPMYDNRSEESFKEKQCKESHYQIEETHLRRRKSKLERQQRCRSTDSSKQCTKDIFTLADLQEEMK